MNMKLRNTLAFVAVTLALVWCIPSVGQVLKGSISGTVVDPQGAVVSGAQVKATNIETNVVSETTSDSSGLFRLNLLPVGTYKVDITAQGFKTEESKGVAVRAGDDTGLGTLHLSIGEASSTLEVTAAAPLVDTTQAQVTNTYSGITLQTFAGLQENEGLDRLALFVPGVSSSRSNNFSNTNGASISSNGIRGRNDDQQIDGQNNNDNSVAGPALFVTDPNLVQQYVIVTNNFGPEYGRNSGSVVNIITKQGTNNWHGSIYGSENNSFLNALSNTQRNTNKPGSPPCPAGVIICNGFTGPPRSNDEFGGFSLGGPIVKNRWFFFTGFNEEVSESNTVDTTSSITPTPQGLATLAACPTVKPAAVALMSSFGPYAISAGDPTPRNQTLATVAGCPNVQVGGVTRVVATPFHFGTWDVRSDAELTSKDNFTGRYILQRNNSFNGSDNGAAGWFDDVLALDQSAIFSETHNFSARMVNEARVSFSRLGVEFGGGLNPLEPESGNLASAFTNITITGALGFGPATNLPQSRLVNTWQAQDNWNYVLGKHTLKAGVNWTYQRSPNVFLPDINGAYRFSSLSSFFSTFAPNRVQIADGDPELDFREYDTFTYFGDDWKIAQNLTLNLGLTWTYFGSPADLFNQITAARESNPATALWLQSLPLSVRTDPSVPAVTNSFGPSVGFAYNPHWGGFFTGNGKTTIRGGYRLAYDPPFYNIFVNISSSSPETFLDTITGAQAAASAPPSTPTGPNVRTSLASLIATNTFDPRTQNETNVANNFGPDKVHLWSLGFERQVTKDSAFEARYVGNHAVNQYQTVDGNPYAGTTAHPGLLQTFPQFIPDASSITPCTATQQSGPGAGTDVGRVNCGLGVARSRNNGAFSDYDALQTQFRATNLFKQLTMTAGYTWSKTLDNTSEIFATGTAGNTVFAAQNPFETGGAERSFSGLNFPNTFQLQFTEQLPFFREQRGAWGHLFGGWTFAADYLAQSGQPYTPIQGLFEALNTTCGAFNGVNCAGPNYYDAGFVDAFLGADAARPFYGSLTAPVNQVGIYAGDACVTLGVGCALPKTTLISYNALNGNGSIASTPTNLVTVTSQQVRYIINGAVSQGVFGTPFGNVARNSLRDAMSNIINASVFKDIKLGERASFQMRLTALNAFNHFNFSSVDPNLEDAGVARFGSDFADPRVTSAAGRTVYVGGRLTF